MHEYLENHKPAPGDYMMGVTHRDWKLYVGNICVGETIKPGLGEEVRTQFLNLTRLNQIKQNRESIKNNYAFDDGLLNPVPTNMNIMLQRATDMVDKLIACADIQKMEPGDLREIIEFYKALRKFNAPTV